MPAGTTTVESRQAERGKEEEKVDFLVYASVARDGQRYLTKHDLSQAFGVGEVQAA